MSPSHSSALTSLNTSNTNVVKNGLVGWWTFDGKNMTNATATDMSGNGNNGTLTNMTATSSATQGKIGQALNFNDIDNYVTAGDVLDFNYTDVRSFSVWVNPSTLQSTVNPTNSIITKQHVSNPFDGWGLALTESGKVRFQYIENLSSYFSAVTNSAVVPVGKWTHIVYIYNNASGQVYINGVPVSSTVSNNTVTGSINNTVELNIGNRENDATGSGTHKEFSGKIDDVRVYNRALSQTEIQTLYKAGGGATQLIAPKGGLVGYWTFDNANLTNATATDSSGGGVNGTLTNMTATSSKVTGKIGQALSFNGTNNTVYYGTPASLDLRGNITMSAWVKPNELNRTQDVIALGALACCGIENELGYTWNGGGGQFHVSYITSGGAAVYGYTNLTSVGNWYHLVGTWDGATKSLYVNGVLAATTSQVSAPADFGNKLFVGSSESGANFNGSIDDVRLYNRALSAAEVRSLYKSGAKVLAATPSGITNPVGVNSGLVGYWTFDGKNMTNATATDSSGNSSNGTLSNGMLAATTTVIGKIGQALRFNGSSDYIAVPGSPNVQNVSYWVKPSANNYSVALSGVRNYFLNNGLFSGTTTATRYINGVIPTSESLGSELITNGGAESGSSVNWAWYANGGAGAGDNLVVTSVSPYAGTYSFDTQISPGGAALGDININNSPATISTTVGSLYKVQFAVKGDVPFSGAGSNVLKATSPFTSASPQYIFDVTTGWVLHTYYFYAERTASDNMIMFQLGGAGSRHIYFDNISVKAVNSVGDVTNNRWNFVSTNLTDAVYSNNMKIGNIDSRYFNGTIDDVRFYNRQLSTTEIRSLYKLGAQ